MSFLVDTDTCSAYLKQVPIVFNRFLQYTGRLHVSLMTVGELHVWARRRYAPRGACRSFRICAKV